MFSDRKVTACKILKEGAVCVLFISKIEIILAPPLHIIAILLVVYP